jgi:hypothetical protein
MLLTKLNSLLHGWRKLYVHMVFFSKLAQIIAMRNN